MKKWKTEIKARSPIDGTLCSYGGPNITAETIEAAQQYCEENGLGYCWVIGQLISEIPCKEGTSEPDWDRRIDYDNLN